MVRFPKFDHADLGLVDDDNTEDPRRAAPANPVVGATGWDRSEPTSAQQTTEGTRTMIATNDITKDVYRGCDRCGADIYDDETCIVTDASPQVCLTCFAHPDTHAAVYPDCITPGCMLCDHFHLTSRIIPMDAARFIPPNAR